MLTTVIKPAFTVVGKLGSTKDGEGFIQRLWEDANAHFYQVEPLAKRDAEGQLMGIWGAMSDFSLAFHPWEEQLTQGLYLAGVECLDGAEAPAGWTKWVVPGFEYRVAGSGSDQLGQTLEALKAEGLSLAGAIHDFFDPDTGAASQYFPVRRL